LGFRPSNPEVEDLARTEEQVMQRQPGYRCSMATLRRLSHTSAYLDLSGGRCRPLRFGPVGIALSRMLARDFGNDRARAVPGCVRRLRRTLEIDDYRQWNEAVPLRRPRAGPPAAGRGPESPVVIPRRGGRGDRSNRRVRWRVAAGLSLLIAVGGERPGHAGRFDAAGANYGRAISAGLFRGITIGPTIGGAFHLSSDHRSASVSGGISASLSKGRMFERTLGACLAGGYRFGPAGYGFVDLTVDWGWWPVSAGLVLGGLFGDAGGGFVLGPQIMGRWRWDLGGAQHEVQLFVRGQLVAAGDYHHEVLFGLRLVYDLSG
jgi:hypothetical protein